MTRNIVDWSKLPLELWIRIIENHKLSVEDVIMVSCVCHSCNRAVRACDKSKLQENCLAQMPCLMLTDGNDDEIYSDTDSYKKYMYEGNVTGLDHNNDSDSDIRSVESDNGEDFENDHDEVDSYYLSINDDRRRVLNLSLKRTRSYMFSLPEAYGKACWGSRYGWIVTLGLDRKMDMFNPITKARLPLPSQATFPWPWKRARDESIRVLFISKVVVLRVPQDGDDLTDDSRTWLVVAIYRTYSLVAVARPGDASWTQIPWHDPNEDEDTHLHAFMDVTYCNKMKSLVFIDQEMNLFFCDLKNTEQPLEFKHYLNGPELEEDQNFMLLSYVAQFNTDLLIIARYKRMKAWDNDYLDGDLMYKTENFRVYRHNSLTKSWEEMQDLSNLSLFVGGNETVCVEGTEVGCRRNCIYYCDEDRFGYRYNKDKVGGHDLGVFDLSTKTVESIYTGNNYLKSSYCGPFWFSPAN